ncbi:MAG: cysteine dioxygenase family protein, partial [Frankia sp.]|nr:cysteine dioxygenase family protein [Frankia sp.]
MEPDVPLVHPALLGLPVPNLVGLAAPDRTTTAPPARGHDGVRGPLAGLVDVLPTALAERVLRDDGDTLDLPTLAELARRLAAADGTWRPVVRLDPRRRWYTRLLLTGVVEVWLISWLPGQHTEVHDHGGALGALAVAEGEVDEDVHVSRAGAWAAGRTRRHRQGDVVQFPVEHVHQVLNRGTAPAVTVHAYSPPELPLRYVPPSAPATAAISGPGAPGTGSL